jgi:hypothetical protein
MAITVVGKQAAQKYEITCSDVNCLNIIHFDQSDVRHVKSTIAGRETKRTEGITCPDCRQILALTDARKIPS